MDEDEIQYQTALDEARMNSAIDQDSTVITAGNVPQKRNEPIMNLLSDMPYILAIITGVGKDIADYFGITSSPIVGTLLTILVVIVLALLIFLASPAEFFQNIKILLGGTSIEIIPVLNLLPVLTASVIYIYAKKILKRIAERKMKVPGASRLARYAAKYS